MMLPWLETMMRRELRALRREVEAYPTDAALWTAAPGVPNSGGNLALHLAGNLRYFVGAVLGGSGYVRDRVREFSARDVPRADLLADIDAASAEVARVLPTLDSATLGSRYPHPIGKVTVGTGEFLLHLACHLAYHLGQVDYHRRLVTGQAATVNAVAVTELMTAKETG